LRILLFTGKGGVGKTTLAAATAVRLAVGGRKALVVSTDPAHSLADAFGVPLSGDPSEVDTCLFAAHVDARRLADRSWPRLRERLRAVLAGAGMAELDAEELTVLPGVDELLALTEVARLADAGPWEVVVVDCGPTAETLRLFALPEAIAGYVGRILPGAGGALVQLAEHLGSLRALLSDPEVTGVRLVLTPERMVLAETRRTLTALALRGIHVDALVANRLVPRGRGWPGPAARWLRTRRAEQDAVLAELAASTPLTPRVVEHRAAEPVGLPALRDLAEELYGGADPLERTGHPAPLLRMRTVGASHELVVALPLSGGSDPDLARIGDDLVVTVDGMRRLIALPALLRRLTITDAEAGPDGLVLRFEPAASEENGNPR
jgi:arsenite-transporting ATPase